MLASTLINDACGALNKSREGDTQARAEFIRKVNLECSYQLPALDFYLGKMQSANPETFPFLNPAAKGQLQEDLQITVLLIEAQIAVDLKMRRKRQLDDLQESLKQCSALLSLLGNEGGSEAEKNQYFEAYCVMPGFFKFQVMEQWIIKKIRSFRNDKFQVIKAFKDALNEIRLFWVWAGRAGFLGMLLAFLDTDSFSTKTAADNLNRPRAFEVNLSWALYLIRFLPQFFLFLRHTFPNDIMTEEEKKMAFLRRLWGEIKYRRDFLLNDSLWGACNYLCCAVLIGTLSGYGDLLTLILLGFDIAMSLGRFTEGAVEFYQLYRSVQGETNAAVLAHYQQAKQDFKWQLAHLSLDLGYSLVLFGAFFIMTLPLLPVSGPAFGAIMLSGAFLCFAATVAYNAATHGLNVFRTLQTIRGLNADTREAFSAIQSGDVDASKLSYLEFKALQQDKDYQWRVLSYQMLKATRDILVGSMVPVLVFVSLMTLPLGLGLVVLGAGITLGMGSKLAVDLFKPIEPKAKPRFDQLEYNNFRMFQPQDTSKGSNFSKTSEVVMSCMG